ncbi:MAG TPA: hypothetical protein VJ183_01295 [Chloroflexia bacterium]|nr:hypothetical protein [Chloroflexia bacterium]
MFRGLTFRGSTAWILCLVVAGALLTLVAGGAGVGAASVRSGSYKTSSSSLSNPPAVPQKSPGADVASWPVANGSVDGVTYSFHYPSAWNSNFLYCAPEVHSDVEGGHLPAGCASTDVLVGQKARDVGLLSGEETAIGGKAARKLVDDRPANVLVSRVYTTMVYDATGTPLFGFTTQIGAGTDAATLDAITANLDVMAGTIKVEAGR